MKPTALQLEALTRLVLDTRPTELTCEQWLHQAGRYADLVVTGEPIPAELRALEDHLRLCAECTEELEALKKLLTSD